MDTTTGVEDLERKAALLIEQADVRERRLPARHWWNRRSHDGERATIAAMRKEAWAQQEQAEQMKGYDDRDRDDGMSL